MDDPKKRPTRKPAKQRRATGSIDFSPLQKGHRPNRRAPDGRPPGWIGEPALRTLSELADYLAGKSENLKHIRDTSGVPIKHLIAWSRSMLILL